MGTGERTAGTGRSRLAAASAALVGLGALVASLAWLGGSQGVGLAGRWALIAGLVLWALGRRSLTAWILVSMVVGAEVGHDWPETAVAMRLLSQIFIRMIKTIIAPLLFATLVVGIAGHPNLRHVGRMGIKALVYFEAVTTVALFIGLATINLTKAGVGVQPPEGLQPGGVTAPRQTISDVILHAFPENVAKSVAEGQVLQIPRPLRDRARFLRRATPADAAVGGRWPPCSSSQPGHALRPCGAGDRRILISPHGLHPGEPGQGPPPLPGAAGVLPLVLPIAPAKVPSAVLKAIAEPAHRVPDRAE
jgi:hypothetical protein